jgi:pyruvate formate lyase activating enzyme
MNEYPGEISAIIFTQGCNFNCKYCFNPDLKPDEPPEESYMDEGELLDTLRHRKDSLTAVTLTGGEPLLQEDIMEFLSELRSMGYKIKINTNGSCYSRLKYIVDYNLVDFIRMDIKAPTDKYEDIICCNVNMDVIKKSIGLIQGSGIDHEFHTVMDEDVLNEGDIKKIKRWIKNDKNYKVGEKK